MQAFNAGSLSGCGRNEAQLTVAMKAHTLRLGGLAECSAAGTADRFAARQTARQKTPANVGTQ